MMRPNESETDRQPRGLVVDRDPAVRAVVREVFEGRSGILHGADNAADALRWLRSERCDIVFVDPAGPGVEQESLSETVGAWALAPLLIQLHGLPDVGEQNALWFDGVADPMRADQVAPVVDRVLKLHEARCESRRLRKQLQDREGYPSIIGHSPAVERLRDDVERLARTQQTVWISGPAGVGKKQIARAIHNGSTSDAPFVRVDCSQLGEDRQVWQRSETPRPGNRSPDVVPGIFDQAIGGTLVLEAIDALSEPQQAALACALEANALEANALEASSMKDNADRVRCMVTHAADPDVAMRESALKPSLVSALAQERLVIPALGQRSEDVPLLAGRFVSVIAELNHLPPIRIRSSAMEVLRNYDWPGNVTELRQALEHSVILAEGGTIDVGDLPERVRGAASAAGDRAGASAGLSLKIFRDAKREVVSEFESRYLADLLERHQGNVTSAAQQAGMLRSALQRLLRKYGLRSADFRSGSGSSSTRSVAGSGMTRSGTGVRPGPGANPGGVGEDS